MTWTRNRGKAAKKNAMGTFGGYRKRTITAREFIGSLCSLAGEAHTMYQIWGKRDFDPGFREELMLAVARLNECRYCTWGHHEWAHASGIPEEELAHLENMNPEGFDRRKWLAVSYVRALVTENFGAVSAELSAELEANYTPHEIKEIELVARVMDLGNRGANTWDAMLSRLRGNPASDSHLLDELVLSGVFWTVAPVAILVLSRATNRPYLEMALSMFDYVSHYEDRDVSAAS